MKSFTAVVMAFLGLIASGKAPLFADDAPPIFVIDSATPATNLNTITPNLHIGETIVFKDDHSRKITVQVGVWEANESAIYLENYPWTEYVLMLSGRVIITNDDGTQNEYIAGDTFVIPKGFTGLWDVREPMKKQLVKVGYPKAKVKSKVMRVGPAT